MKIVKLEEFLKLPVGTPFMSYQPVVLNGLYIKGNNVNDNDFIYADVLPHGENGDRIILESAQARWGMFDWDEEFLILDAKDVYAIMRLLTNQEIDDIVLELE